MRTQNIKKQRTEQKDGEKTHFLNRKKKRMEKIQRIMPTKYQ